MCPPVSKISFDFGKTTAKLPFLQWNHNISVFIFSLLFLLGCQEMNVHAFAQRLKLSRIHKGFSQSDLEEISGVRGSYRNTNLRIFLLHQKLIPYMLWLRRWMFHVNIC